MPNEDREFEKIIQSIAGLFEETKPDAETNLEFKELEKIGTTLKELQADPDNKENITRLEQQFEKLQELHVKWAPNERKDITVENISDQDAQIKSIIHHGEPLVVGFKIGKAHYENGQRTTPILKQIQFFINSRREELKESLARKTEQKTTQSKYRI